ncbi:hypothetical protein [Bdellovibrio sp. BCCA]|uniref:hypothetical protein n=1 Tax=Bdellovibrio sp. BCCA TaxID=3136281 RepID=UPI0030F214B0
MKRCLMILVFLFSGSTAIAKNLIAKWSENSVGISVAEFSGEEKSSTQFSLLNEQRLERHSFLSQVTYASLPTTERSLTNYSFGYAYGPDWEMPFEPRIDIRGGVTYLKEERGDGDFHPSVALRGRIVTLKMGALSLGLSMEVGHLYRGGSYLSSGISIIVGAQ